MQRPLILVDRNSDRGKMYPGEWRGHIETELEDGEFRIILVDPTGTRSALNVSIRVENSSPTKWKFLMEGDEEFRAILPGVSAFNGELDKSNFRYEVLVG